MTTAAEVLAQVLASQRPSKTFVLECEYHSRTNTPGLGRSQRAVLGYLRTAPYGFGGSHAWSSSGEVLEHGHPIGVTTEEITAAIFGEQTPARRRTVQRISRQLQARGVADCWHGTVGELPRQLTTLHGDAYTTNRPVSGLYVAARWDCPHLPERTKGHG